MCAEFNARIAPSPAHGLSAASKFILAFLVVCFAAAALLAIRPAARGGFVAANILAGGAVALLWWRGDVHVRVVLAFALLFRLFYVGLPPVLSDDVYRYIWDGLLQVRGINPFAYTPDDPQLSFLHGEPVYAALNSASFYTVYPPLSQLVFRVGAWFYEANWQVSYYAIKGVLATSEAAAVLLLARHLPARSLMLYAWNPLVVLAAAGQAHTESLAVFCLVTAWLLARQKRGEWASVALAGAGLVKLYPFVLFPLLWRRFGWRSVTPGALVVAFASVPYVHPDAIAHVLSSLELYVRSFEFNAGIYYGIKKIFEILTGADWSKQIGPAFRLLFLLSLPIVYVVDWRRGWSFRRAAVATLGLFFVLSTTIHPWYLLPLLALVAPATPPSWHWHWLGLASVGTYLLYVGGPYWLWVTIGWCGWAVLFFIRNAETGLAGLMQLRARQKADLISEYMPSVVKPSILDFGAGEGYVGRELASRLSADVTLADIRDMNRTNLPMIVYDGRRLPFGDNTFDVVLLMYVLHHAADPDVLIAEAQRVCRGRIVVVESIYTNGLQRAVLSVLDRTANYVRSKGMIYAWRERLQFGTFESWNERFDARGLRVLIARDLGGIIHRRAIFVLAP